MPEGQRMTTVEQDHKRRSESLGRMVSNISPSGQGWLRPEGLAGLKVCT